MGIRIAKVLNLLDLCSSRFFVASLNAGIYVLMIGSIENDREEMINPDYQK